MPELIPVEGDPFNDPPSNLVPVDHDPWAATGTPPPGQMTDADRAQVMRVGAAVAAPIDAVMGAPSRAAAVNPYPLGSEEWQFYENSRTRGIEQAGPEMAMAMAGGGTPFAERGALGAAGGGIKAYHGSPHDFPAERLIQHPTGTTEYIVGTPSQLPDVPAGATILKDFPLGRMRMDKIGTGEGAQAYGHGLYNAEAEPVAQQYRDVLASRNEWQNGPEGVAKFWAHMKGGREQAIEHIESSMAQAKKYPKNFEPDAIEKSQAAIDYLKSGGDLTPSTPGKMYEVNINADPEHFLDWDKPLSKQHPKVQETFAGKVSGNEPLGNAISRAQHNEIFAGDLVGMDRATPDQMIQKLHEAGIPGIKYLDQGSRNTGQFHVVTDMRPGENKYLVHGPGNISHGSFDTREAANAFADAKNTEGQTHNYVVFHHNLVDIIKKYGLAGLVAGGAAHFTTTPIDHDPYEKKKETAGAS